MKKLSLLLAVLLVICFSFFAMASGQEENADQGKDAATAEAEDNNELGDYSVTIDSCRLAKDYEGKYVAIVKYTFTNNNDDDPTAFYIAFEDAAYQGGVGLNKAFFLAESANYNADNQTKEIKKGSSIEVEVAYTLNDTTTDVEIEVKELISFDDKTITKTFTIA